MSDIDSKPKGEITRRELLKMALPHDEATPSELPNRRGEVSLDKSRCTGCGLCAIDCPTGALAISAAENNLELSFNAGLCTACGKCIEICPEKCLSLREATESRTESTVLYTDKLVHCRACGTPIGTAAMLTVLRQRIADDGLSAQLELCPECKMKTRVRLK